MKVRGVQKPKRIRMRMRLKGQFLAGWLSLILTRKRNAGHIYFIFNLRQNEFKDSFLFLIRLLDTPFLYYPLVSLSDSYLSLSAYGRFYSHVLGTMSDIDIRCSPGTPWVVPCLKTLA